MAMIVCPECGHHISSLAAACPECGAPVAHEGEAQQPAPTPAPKDTTARNILTVAVILLGLIIGGLYYYDYRSEQQREQRAYELLQGCSNPAFYEDFIIRFPKSQYISDVQDRYKRVASQQKEWQQMVADGNADQLRKFVSEHPTSPYVKIAQGRIDSIDWAEAKELQTLEAVTHYMTTHPEGFYIDQAETLRQTLERKRAEAAAAAAAARRDSLALVDSLSL